MSPLERLQYDVAGRLQADAYFAEIAVHVFRPRLKADGTEETAPMIANAIQQSLKGLTKGSKAGAAVSVLMPLANVNKPEVEGPNTDLTLTIRVQESAALNMSAIGTGKSCEEIAIEVLRLLHGVNLSGLRGVRQRQYLTASRPALTPNLQFDPLITYDAQLEVEHQLTPVRRADAPRIGIAGATVTILGGSSIYYTLDGSYPWSGNPAAALYAGPFSAPPPGTTIRAVAYRAGLSASDTTTIITT